MVQEFLQISYDAENKIWTSTHYPYKNQIYGSLGERFLKTMRSINSNKIIDYFYDTNRQKTAKEVYEQSITVAKNLQRLGIKNDDVVSFYCMNNEDIAVLTLGCILAGALVNYFEVHMLPEHDDNVFSIVKPTIILYEEKYKSKLFESLERSNLKSCKYIISIDGQEELNVKNELLKYEEIIDYDNFESVTVRDPQNKLVYLVLTSGSTGEPKVVEITHALIMHGMYIWWNNKNNIEPITQESIILSFSPLRWISQVLMLLQSMLMGIKRVSCCGTTNGKYGLEVLRQNKITHLFLSPPIFHDILMELDAKDKESLKSLKMVQLGGEPSSDILIDMARKHCVNAHIYRCYGMTEMTSVIANDEDINGGKLLPGYQMQILDDKCQPLGPNRKGQIALKPPYPLKGYRGIDNKKYYNEKGFLINGDYGFIDSQDNLHILARYKDLIYSNNLILIPNSLEHIITSLPEVSVARLAGYRKTPEDPNQVGAFFIVLNPGITSSHDEITKKIFNTLKLHITPCEVAIIKDVYYIDSIPITTCGKTDRVALKNWALNMSQQT